MILSGVEPGREERRDEIACEPWPDDLGAKAHYIHVVMLDRLMARMDIMTYGGPDALHLVAGDCGPDTRAADHEPPLRSS
jgi:hypothetical protein